MFRRVLQTKTGISSLIILLAVLFSAICPGRSYSQRAASAKPTATATPVPTCCLPATTTQWESSKAIYQQFPARGPAETAWVVVWSENGNRGLWIEGAWFWRKKPFTAATVIQVLGRAGLSDIFVPYHLGSPRFYDLHFGGLHGAIPQDAGDCGAITDPLVPSPIANTNDPPRRVLIKEIRDRGVAWTSDRQTRRGEEMLLWATFDAGNYEFVMQYGFRDDGTVTFRLGSTGYNNPEKPFVTHMHTSLWYVDINLAGAAHNAVMLMKHLEPTSLLTATDSMVPFNNGVEGFADWNDEEFTHLNISNTLVKNSQGRNISYDLMPMRTGTARHFEGFSHHDFWVTRMNSNELDYVYGLAGGALSPYINPPQPIMDTDVAVWHISSNHHIPRDEDHEYVPQLIRLPGVALTMWSGFDLHPRNLFDDTPLHQPTCAPVPANLVAWWPLDDASGGTTVADIDATGAAVPTLYGTPQPGALGSSGPTPVSGAVSGALSFDGVNDYVQIPNSPALNFGSGNFSIDAWINTSQNTGVRTIIDKRVQSGSNYQGYSLFTSAGKLGIQLADGPHFMNYGSSGANANIADGNWHHIAVTVNRTGANPEITWYVDSIPVGNPTSLVGSPVTGSLTNSSPLRLGVRSISLSGHWKGILDELELFNSVLAESEVFAIFAAGRAGKCR